MAAAHRELEGLARLPGVQGSMITGRDGLLIEATLERRRAEALGALVAAAYGAASGLGEDIPSLREPEELMVEAEKGTLHVVPSGGDYLLAVLATTAGNLGMIRFEMRHAAERLATLE